MRRVMWLLIPPCYFSSFHYQSQTRLDQNRAKSLIHYVRQYLTVVVEVCSLSVAIDILKNGPHLCNSIARRHGVARTTLRALTTKVHPKFFFSFWLFKRRKFSYLALHQINRSHLHNNSSSRCPRNGTVQMREIVMSSWAQVWLPMETITARCLGNTTTPQSVRNVWRIKSVPLRFHG